jgi:hypothetical protein
MTRERPVSEKLTLRARHGSPLEVNVWLGKGFSSRAHNLLDYRSTQLVANNMGTMMFVKILRILCGTAAVLASSAAMGAASYCNSGVGDADITVNDDTPALRTSDMTYNSGNATDCYGKAAGNDDDAAINGLNWGAGWALAARDNVGGGDTSNIVAGLQWSLAGGTGTMGTWTLTGVDTNGGAPANIGDTFDFVGVLKGGSGWAAYFFDNVVFDGSDGGTWKIVFENNGGQIPDLSHMSVYARFQSSGGGGGGGGGGTPEPMTLALVGLSLLGLGVNRRRLRGT